MGVWRWDVGRWDVGRWGVGRWDVGRWGVGRWGVGRWGVGTLGVGRLGEACPVQTGRLLRPLFLSFSLWRRDVGTGASAPVSAPAPPLAPPRRFPVSPFPRLPRSRPRRLFLSSTPRHPSQRGRLPPSRASPPPRHHQPSPSHRLAGSPSPLPVLLPLEKGRRYTRLGSGERSASPLAPPRRLPVSPSPQVSTSSSLPLIDSSAPPTTRPPSHRHEHPLPPAPPTLPVSLWRRDAPRKGLTFGPASSLHQR